jgi:UDP-2-acetamido-2-deoxy-ribo-hexuluronate aminotransferase
MFALDDAAQGFGAALHGKRLGAWGDAAALSFYPTKTLGAYGDGGALLTNDAARADLYRSLRTHGEGKTRYEVERTGMNGRLDTLQATILLAKMSLFEGELAQRRRLGAAYDSVLAGKVGIQVAPAGAENAYGLYTIRLPDAAARTRVQQGLAAQQIGSGIYYPKPLHHQPAYAAHHAGSAAGGPAPLPVSEALCHQVLSLPMHPYMSEADAERAGKAVLAAL